MQIAFLNLWIIKPDPLLPVSCSEILRVDRKYRDNCEKAVCSTFSIENVNRSATGIWNAIECSTERICLNLQRETAMCSSRRMRRSHISLKIDGTGTPLDWAGDYGLKRAGLCHEIADLDTIWSPAIIPKR